MHGPSKALRRLRLTRRPTTAFATVALVALTASPSGLVVNATNQQPAGIVHAPETRRPKPGSPPGMRLVFNDEFAGSSLDSSKWDPCYPWANTGVGCTNFGNPELEWYLPSQNTVSGNALHLNASKTATSGTTRDGQPKKYDWRSGMVTTYHSFQFTYGYVAVRARVPKGDGLWSGLFLLPRSEAWPPEIDIAETYGDDTNKFNVVLQPAQGPQFPTSVSAPSDLSTGYHTYAVDWEPSSITWSIDGKTVHRYTGDRSPSEPMYLVADLAVANLFGIGPTASSPSQGSLDIAAVSIFQR